MMYDTSVTIVVISPNIKESKWIDWEIEYSLKNIQRKNRTSHTNGVVGVIMKYNGDYSWFKSTGINCHGNVTSSYQMDKVYKIISNNHFNSNPKQWHCSKCEAYDFMNGSYITFVEEEDFLEIQISILIMLTIKAKMMLQDMTYKKKIIIRKL